MTLEKPSVSELASIQEVSKALTTLSQADKARLAQSAKLRCAGLSGMTWEDLISEAAARALAGDRRWPRDVPFIAFLIQTIRSIANEEWRRSGREPVMLDSDLASDETDAAAAVSELVPDPLSVERQVVARKTLAEIEALFSDDEECKAILQGLAEGLAPDEIQSTHELTSTQYASAQKRIRRTLARHFVNQEAS